MILLYAIWGGPWWLFAILFLLPDLSFAAYLAGPRTGALVYNAAHSTIVVRRCAVADAGQVGGERRVQDGPLVLRGALLGMSKARGDVKRIMRPQDRVQHRRQALRLGGGHQDDAFIFLQQTANTFELLRGESKSIEREG